MTETKESIPELMNRIAIKSGKSQEEIEQLIASKKAKFAGLLTEQGATFLVAKELGVRVNLESYYGQTMNINQLREGLKNIDVHATVTKVYPVREYESKGKKGTRCSLIIGDDTGEISLTVWNERAQELSELENGSQLLLKGCYVSTYNNEIQLNLGMNGSIIIESTPAGSMQKINGIQENENQVTLAGRIVRVFPASSFEHKGKPGKRIRFELADETGMITGIAWNEPVNQIEKLNIGQVIKISKAYTKKGLQGNIEVHLGLEAEIEIDPTLKSKIPLLKDLRKEIERKGIGTLGVGEKFKEIRAKIIGIERGKLYYLACPKCKNKLEHSENNKLCEKCGIAEKPLAVAVISLTLEDETGKISATFFERQAEQVMKLKVEEIQNQLQQKTATDILGELSTEIVGKEIIVTGSTRLNPFSNELGFTAREVIEMA